MNQGRPPPGIAHLIETASGRIRSEAMSSKLCRYVCATESSSASRIGLSASHSPSDIGIFPACWWKALHRNSGGLRLPSTIGVMSTHSDHVPWGFSSTSNVAPSCRTRPNRLNVSAVPARQRIELVAVETDEPAREVPHVVEEESLRPPRLDIAVGVGVEERRAVEDDELVRRHCVAFCPVPGGLSRRRNARSYHDLVEVPATAPARARAVAPPPRHRLPRARRSHPPPRARRVQLRPLLGARASRAVVPAGGHAVRAPVARRRRAQAASAVAASTEAVRLPRRR